MRLKGETVFPPAVILDRGKSFFIPSKEKGRVIPCRVMRPEGRKGPGGWFPKGLLMYIHGGGWVLSSEKE